MIHASYNELTKAGWAPCVRSCVPSSDRIVLEKDGVALVHTYSVRPRDDGQGWAVDVFDGRRAWTKTHLGEQPLNKAEAHRLAHKLRDPKFYTARTKRAVNSLTIERGSKVVSHE